MSKLELMSAFLTNGNKEGLTESIELNEMAFNTKLWDKNVGKSNIHDIHSIFQQGIKDKSVLNKKSANKHVSQNTFGSRATAVAQAQLLSSHLSKLKYKRTTETRPDGSIVNVYTNGTNRVETSYTNGEGRSAILHVKTHTNYNSEPEKKATAQVKKTEKVEEPVKKEEQKVEPEKKSPNRLGMGQNIGYPRRREPVNNPWIPKPKKSESFLSKAKKKLEQIFVSTIPSQKGKLDKRKRKTPTINGVKV